MRRFVSSAERVGKYLVQLATRFRSRFRLAEARRGGGNASLGYKPPAPEVFVPAFAAWPAALRQPASPATLAPRLVLN
jgi:hypothetical protein